ncbi:MAG: hypothetical protein BAJALOKI3v1_240002 [Promethearchaeota archaeon]|nr:MAG: hypothetical protein BAJALOKI3v1_240002 [Candidatus Lokiarchaeota archaeon]
MKIFLFSFYIISLHSSNLIEETKTNEKIEILGASYTFGDDYFNGTGTGLN